MVNLNHRDGVGPGKEKMMKSVAMKKIEELNISILGDIEIVSSGYSDRYALLTTWMVIESESVK